MRRVASQVVAPVGRVGPLALEFLSPADSSSRSQPKARSQPAKESAYSVGACVGPVHWRPAKALRIEQSSELGATEGDALGACDGDMLGATVGGLTQTHLV